MPSHATGGEPAVHRTERHGLPAPVRRARSVACREDAQRAATDRAPAASRRHRQSGHGGCCHGPQTYFPVEPYLIYRMEHSNHKIQVLFS